LSRSAIDASGRINVRPLGLRRRWLADSYVRLMAIKWRYLFLIFTLGFFAFNLVFAALYSIVPGSLAHSVGGGPVSPVDAFFFSVQTVATVGYGELYPKSLYANALTTVEVMAGVIGFAMGTGLMFARFSRPTARIMFSKVAVIAPHNGVPTLMFRAANQRHNLILEAHVRVAITRDEVSDEGRTMRRFHDLKLERRDNPTFILSWTVMHRIDETSPFYGLSPQEIAARQISIVVLMTGTDESFAQPVYARYNYTGADIVWNRHFVDIIGVSERGESIIDYTKFHSVEEIFGA